MKHFVGFLCLRLILCVLLALPVQVLLRMNGNDEGIANAQSSATRVKHKPLEYFVSGKRIHISAEVTDKEGVKLARCYFRSKDGTGSDYFFIDLSTKAEREKNVYQGILPAPLQKIQEMEYLFLIVNNRNQIVKTETFVAKQKEAAGVPAWQTANVDGQILISTEIGQVLTAPEGFEENIVVDITDTSKRFGIVAGMYGVTQAAMAGGITGDTAVAVSLGDIKTDTGRISWLWWVLGGAVVVGSAAAAGGGGGGGGTTVTSTIPTTTTTSSSTSTSTSISTTTVRTTTSTSTSTTTSTVKPTCQPGQINPTRNFYCETVDINWECQNQKGSSSYGISCLQLVHTSAAVITCGCR